MGDQAHAWVLTDVALIVRGEGLVPDDVTELLGLQPTAVRQPGIDPNGYSAGSAGQWRLQSDDRVTKNLDEQLDAVISRVEPREDALRKLRDRGADIFVRITGYSNNDCQIVLSADEMERIARLGVTLVLSPSMSER